MYDMFIGGVSGTLEPSLVTAVRELGEELGLGPCGGVIGSAEDHGVFVTGRRTLWLHAAALRLFFVVSGVLVCLFTSRRTVWFYAAALLSYAFFW